MQADIGPGMRVLEAGVGSGALSMTLLRAGASITGLRDPRGLRPARPSKNVHDMLGEDVDYDVHIRDVTAGIDEIDLDRVILDMPEPWDVVKHAEGALRPGGSCSPTCRRSTRPSCYARRCASTPLDSRRRSRSFDGPGTSTDVRFVPITAWWRTPGSSPRRAPVGAASGRATSRAR